MSELRERGGVKIRTLDGLAVLDGPVGATILHRGLGGRPSSYEALLRLLQRRLGRGGCFFAMRRLNVCGDAQVGLRPVLLHDCDTFCFVVSPPRTSVILQSFQFSDN